MARQKCEVFDLECNKLRARDWVKSATSDGEKLIIPIETVRSAIRAISIHGDVLRIFVEVEK
jgi:hypothetical protein